jgi:hypothetical protein
MQRQLESGQVVRDRPLRGGRHTGIHTEMPVLLWMVFQATLVGLMLARDPLSMPALPVYLLGTLSALAIAIVARGLAEWVRFRRARAQPGKEAKAR